ncbi:MAG: hypothetical protein ACT4PE_07905 [Candidatus Eiseniibacteriota bacterium]
MTQREVWSAWWPLAASWLMMGLELPMVSAVMARLPDPEIHLAAYGGVVFPVAMLIEAPIIMLLSASTALSRDRASYAKLRRFMMWAGGALTALHLAVATTPLFDVVVGGLLDAPEPIREPARVGLLIMTPWTWSIAYRRFQQGVMIRFGRSRLVGTGTAVRLGTIAVVLAVGSALGPVEGIVLGAVAVVAGVMAEAAFAGVMVRRVVADALPKTDPGSRPLTLRTFLAFYTPLAVTATLTLLTLPLTAAAISRMPRPLESLAVWPVISGLTFTLRSLGHAYNEVVVALVDRPGAFRALRRFATGLGVLVTLALVAIAATPFARVYFAGVSGLSEPLTALALTAVWVAIPLPAASVVQHWLQGILTAAHRTKAIGEAILLYVAVTAGVLAAGIAAGTFPGIEVGLAAAGIGYFAQSAWLFARSRPVRRAFSGATHAPVEAAAGAV